MSALDRAIQHSLEFAVRKLPDGKWQGWATSAKWECFRQANDPETALARAVDACIKVTLEDPLMVNGLRQVSGTDERKPKRNLSTSSLMEALGL